MAQHLSDYNKESAAIVLDLINEQHGTAFTPGQLALGEPVAGDGKVTTLTVSAKVGSGYRGAYSFSYNRVPLPEVPNLTEEVTHEVDITKFSDVVTFLNNQFGLNIGPDDVMIDGVDLTVEDPAYSSEFDEVKTFNVTAKNKSLVWLGEAALSLTRVRQELGSVWTNSNPDGLYAPSAPIVYPTDAYMVQSPDGSVRTTSDGSIRTFAGIDPNAA